MTLGVSPDIDLWTTFTAKAELLGAAVVRAHSEEAAAHLLHEAAPTLVLTGSAAARFPSIAAQFARAGGEAAPEVAALAEFGVAETGSLALNEPRVDRGVCFLADRLWLLVPHERIIATIDEALVQLADLTRAGERNHPLLMSGPSRTADIERVLTIGVHGPRSLVAVIVDTPVR